MMSTVFLAMILEAHGLGADGATWVDIPCPSPAEGAPAITRVFRFAPGEAQAFAQIAMNLVGKDAGIVSTGQAVIVVAPEPVLEYLSKVAGAALERDEEPVTEIFRVPPEDAKGLAAILTSLFGPQGPRTVRGDRIVPDPERGLIIVHAEKDAVREIARVLEEVKQAKPRPALAPAKKAAPAKPGAPPAPIPQAAADKAVAMLATAGSVASVRLAAGKLEISMTGAGPEKLIAALRKIVPSGAAAQGIALSIAKDAASMAVKLSFSFSEKEDPAAAGLLDVILRAARDGSLPLRRLDIERAKPGGWRIRLDGQAVSREAAQRARDAILRAVEPLAPHPRAEELVIQEEKGGAYLMRLVIAAGA
ncbi:MAG: hypothetical protein JXP34_01590 [Planctomycetes bacterium]|nr:hypothetical protein [Planctomycetota bacterium]